MGEDGICAEFVDTGRCGHSDTEHDRMGDAMTAAVPDPTVEALSEAEREALVYPVERILAARAAAPDALRVRLLAMADAWTTRDVLQRSGWAADCIRAEIERALLEDGAQ